MSTSANGAPRLDAAQVLDALRALRNAPKNPAYWQMLATCLGLLCRARTVHVLRAEPAGAWSVLGAHGLPHSGPPGEVGLGTELLERLATLAPRAQAQGHAHEPLRQGGLVAVVRLLDPDGATQAVLTLDAQEKPFINELLVRAQLVADVPTGSAPPQARGGQPDTPPNAPPATAPGHPADPSWLSLLDLVARVMQDENLGAAALSLVNLMAAQLPCDQAVLGLYQHGQVRVLAISHIDRFDPHTSNLQLLEAALEEALDQQTDLVFPALGDDGVVLLAHDRLSRLMGYAHLNTLVVRHDHSADDTTPHLALLLAHRQGGLNESRSHQISVALHLLKPWLLVLNERSQSWWQRSAQRLRQGARTALSPEAPGRKALVALAAVALATVVFGTWPYRIEASGELATDSVQTLSAPFDGFLGKVHHTLGDSVAAHEVLAELDTRDLLLQAQDLRSEVLRYGAEADRARAQNQTADTQIAAARATQAQARLERVQFQLQQARIEAPFGGVIVEGERKELAGMPIHQGDKLFRLARIEGLYAVLHVSERDMQALPARASGRLLLLSQPDQPIAFELEQLVPVAQVKGGQAGQFQLKVRLAQDPAPWWRPGMSALALIDAGRQPIWWIWTHKWIDTLRMMLWW